ncbi:MarR family winged helix-turn-helix transcriptional regulator [Agrobacterium tumefaciens]|uniref:MarR family winged helix-turn-helix transcriptional regulator n=1 Tax=Agrobacterium tumefaciens TaxID=358 RepID=UPI001572AC6E|nr:winged helix-turn-helix transcriptional regulator [Agrobacterium tumefaciens]
MDENHERDLCFVLVRFARLLSRELNSSLRPLGLTGEQVALLDAIETIPTPRSKDVCLALRLDPSTISANIKPLLQQGLIVSLDDPTDRRAKRLELSPEGRTKLLSARAILLEIDNTMKRKLDENGSLKNVTLALDRLC